MGKGHWLTGKCGMVVLLALAGCAAPGPSLTPRQREIESAARPILALDPDVEWNARFNRLIEFGGEAIDYLVSQPALQHRAAPDDLETLLHTSLIRLLGGRGAPALTLNCYETTLDLLHFDPRVDGRPLGEICIPVGMTPTAWHDVYPHRVARQLVQRVDAEADRQAIVEWWRQARQRGQTSASGRELRPQLADVAPVLSRRYADVWVYETDRKAVLVSNPAAQLVPGTALMQVATTDYNLVRAACIWLGTRTDDAAQQRLIELIGDESPITVHNALFSLRFSRDPRIRQTIQRYNSAAQRAP
jgi:hypothetical protein